MTNDVVSKNDTYVSDVFKVLGLSTLIAFVIGIVALIYGTMANSAANTIEKKINKLMHPDSMKEAMHEAISDTLTPEKMKEIINEIHPPSVVKGLMSEVITDVLTPTLQVVILPDNDLTVTKDHIPNQLFIQGGPITEVRKIYMPSSTSLTDVLTLTGSMTVTIFTSYTSSNMHDVHLDIGENVKASAQMGLVGNVLRLPKEEPVHKLLYKHDGNDWIVFCGEDAPENIN